ncbi:pentapeptide repeat-containing protein [Lyngbya aestuarii]|uniref:pentapeptide repeat-containing protein n=1 Tax=Lyngbya aestuarii TaxID=118322 RepID=UPI00403DAB64
MPNQQHVICLRQGSIFWNQWRESNPQIKPDLKKGIFRGSLSGVNLNQANLSEADINKIDLSEANLSQADLSRARVSYANLSGANLSSANLWVANLSDTDLRGANLSNADLRGVDFSQANLRGANLSGANLSLAKLSGANLSEANLSRAILVATKALGTNFSHTIFTEAILDSWQLNKVTNLEEVICDYCYLKSHQRERSPKSGKFAPGEFKQRFGLVTEEVVST